MADERTEPAEKGELTLINRTPWEVALARVNDGRTSAVELPKPFSSPICLVPESRIVREKRSRRAEPGSRLVLERDIDFRRDPLAIRAVSSDGVTLGWVAADCGPILARLMDAGKSLYAEVIEDDGSGIAGVTPISIWMED